MTGASGDPIRRTHDPSDPESAPSWLEQLDSLRPGSHDDEAPEVATLRDRLSQDPDVARMRDRLERLDIAIASAMDDLAAPPGLADRLLTRLADDRASTVEPDPVVATIGTPDGTSAAEVPADEVTSPGVNRRRWITRAIQSIAAAAAVTMLAFYAWQPAEQLQAEDVLQLGIERFATEQRDGDLAPFGEGAAPEQFALPRLLAAHRHAYWRPVDFLGREGVAYHLRNSRGAPGVVYVVPLPDGVNAGELARQPLASVKSTAGLASTAWTDGDRLFVLVMRGNASGLSRFFHAPGPVA